MTFLPLSQIVFDIIIIMIPFLSALPPTNWQKVTSGRNSFWIWIDDDEEYNSDDSGDYSGDYNDDFDIDEYDHSALQWSSA